MHNAMDFMKRKVRNMKFARWRISDGDHMVMNTYHKLGN